MRRLRSADRHLALFRVVHHEIDAFVQLHQFERVLKTPYVAAMNPQVDAAVEAQFANRNVYTLLTLTPGVESAQNSIWVGCGA